MQAIDILGSPGSPYTRKMLALMRYRHISYRVLWGSHFDPPVGYPTPKVKLLPTFFFHTPEGVEAVVDSTPIIARLEALHSDRSVCPTDPVLHFLNLLMEDFADEWLTKAMFHYRWHHAEDAAHAGPLLAFWQNPQISDHEAHMSGTAFSQRQISRLHVVGSSALTAPVIEASYERLVGILDRIIARQGFVLGARPASADFALYGQLTQLACVDPTPARFLENHSPRLRAWLDWMEDLSGHSATQWLEPAAIASHVGELLHEIGRVYAPFLVANAHAVVQGQKSFETTIDGKPWAQPVFPYQYKCLEHLRLARSDLTLDARNRLDAVLRGTGCEVLFS